MSPLSHDFNTRVLIVSENPAVRRFLHGGLSSDDYDVIEQDTVVELLEFVQWSEPDIILLALEDRQGGLAAYASLCDACPAERTAIALLAFESPGRGELVWFRPRTASVPSHDMLEQECRRTTRVSEWFQRSRP